MIEYILGTCDIDLVISGFFWSVIGLLFIYVGTYRLFSLKNVVLDIISVLILMRFHVVLFNLVGLSTNDYNISLVGLIAGVGGSYVVDKIMNNLKKKIDE